MDAKQTVAAIPSCALTEEGLRSQHERMRQLGPSVADFHRGEDHMTIEFQPGFDRRLLDQALAVEQECCPFFRFDFDEAARQLTVRVDDLEYRAGLDALAYAFGQGNSPASSENST